jgi:hypothetical protein
MKRNRLAVVGILMAALSLGCGGGGESGADLAVGDLALPPPLCTDPVPPDGGVAPTFANVQKLFDGRCLYACHCCSGEVDLNSGHAWADLVGVPAPATATTGDLQCGGTLVTPGDPAHSYLYQKLTLAMPCYGRQMPLTDSGGSLPDCEIDLIRRWILSGAPND